MTNTPFPLTNNTTLITGGAKRLGRAIALALAAHGANIIIHYNTSLAEAEQTAHEIRQLGAQAHLVRADLANPTDAENLISLCTQTCGTSITHLINNASIFPGDRLMDFTPDDLALNIQVNAMSPLQIGRAYFKQSTGGCIINLLDCRMHDYDSLHVAYHLSKRMLFSLTRMMAVEFAPSVRVNAVAPGLVLPPEGKDDQYLQDLKCTNPLNMVGTPEQIADAVLYLLQAQFVTGQVIYIDGGRHMKGNLYG